MAVEQIPPEVLVGPYSQIAGAVTVIVGIVYAIFRGLKDRGRADLPLPSEQRWFFDGPLAEALRYMREAAESNRLMLGEMRQNGEAAREAHRNEMRAMEDIKRVIDDLPSRRRRSE